MTVIAIGFPTIVPSALDMTDAQAPASSTATILLLGLVAAMVIIVGVMGRIVGTLMFLIRGLLGLLMAQLGRLLLIGMCLLCLVVVLTAQPSGGAEPQCGISNPTTTDGGQAGCERPR